MFDLNLNMAVDLSGFLTPLNESMRTVQMLQLIQAGADPDKVAELYQVPQLPDMSKLTALLLPADGEKKEEAKQLTSEKKDGADDQAGVIRSELKEALDGMTLDELEQLKALRDAKGK